MKVWTVILEIHDARKEIKGKYFTKKELELMLLHSVDLTGVTMHHIKLTCVPSYMRQSESPND